MHSRRYLVAIYLLAAIGARGQAPGALEGKDRAGVLQQAIFDPTMKSSVSAPNAQIALEGTNDQGTVTGRIGIYVHEVVLETKLSAPIGKTASEANLIDLDGLPNKGTADFGATWMIWNPTADSVKQRAACASYLTGEGIAKDGAEADTLLLKTTDKGEIAYPCTRLALKGKYRDQFDKAVNWGTPVLVTGRAKVGRQQYDYADPPLFNDANVVHTSYGFNGAVGVIIPTGDFIQASFQYQKGYNEQDSEQVCTPITGSTSSHCRDIAVGAPTAQLKKIVQLEARIFPSLSVGFNPKFAYDFVKSAVSLQMPIYMFHAKEGGLNGGVTAGWRSDTRSFKVALFVGQVFTLIAH
jgi:hypothetical protein